MFEDLASNLIIPHERGMTTVLVVPKPGQMDHREPFEIFHDTAPPHIDFVTSDLERFLTGLAPDDPGHGGRLGAIDCAGRVPKPLARLANFP